MYFPPNLRFYEKSIILLKNNVFRPGLRILNSALFSHVILGAFSSKTNFFVNFTIFTKFQLVWPKWLFSPQVAILAQNVKMAILPEMPTFGPQNVWLEQGSGGLAPKWKFGHFT